MSEKKKWEYDENADSPVKDELPTSNFTAENWYVDSKKEDADIKLAISTIEPVAPTTEPVAPIADSKESTTDLDASGDKPLKKSFKKMAKNEWMLVLSILFSVVSSLWFIFEWESEESIITIAFALISLVVLKLKKEGKENVFEKAFLVFSVVPFLIAIYYALWELYYWW